MGFLKLRYKNFMEDRNRSILGAMHSSRMKSKPNGSYARHHNHMDKYGSTNLITIDSSSYAFKEEQQVDIWKEYLSVMRKEGKNNSSLVQIFLARSIYFRSVSKKTLDIVKTAFLNVTMRPEVPRYQRDVAFLEQFSKFILRTKQETLPPSDNHAKNVYNNTISISLDALVLWMRRLLYDSICSKGMRFKTSIFHEGELECYERSLTSTVESITDEPVMKWPKKYSHVVNKIATLPIVKGTLSPSLVTLIWRLVIKNGMDLMKSIKEVDENNSEEDRLIDEEVANHPYINDFCNYIQDPTCKSNHPWFGWCLTIMNTLKQEYSFLWHFIRVYCSCYVQMSRITIMEIPEHLRCKRTVLCPFYVCMDCMKPLTNFVSMNRLLASKSQDLSIGIRCKIVVDDLEYGEEGVIGCIRCKKSYVQVLDPAIRKREHITKSTGIQRSIYHSWLPALKVDTSRFLVIIDNRSLFMCSDGNKPDDPLARMVKINI